MDCLAQGGVKVIVHSLRLEGLQTFHPVVLTVFQQSLGLGFGDVSVVYLFYKRETCMFVEIMSGKCEVFIERASVATRDILSMSIYSQIRWRLAFSDILRAPA